MAKTFISKLALNVFLFKQQCKQIRYWAFKRGKNDTCSICLENIRYIKQPTIYCKICKNSVHTSCWSKYYYLFKQERCVLCRSYLDLYIPY